MFYDLLLVGKATDVFGLFYFRSKYGIKCFIEDWFFETEKISLFYFLIFKILYMQSLFQSVNIRLNGFQPS